MNEYDRTELETRRRRREVALSALWDEAERLTAMMPVGTLVRYWPGVREGEGRKGHIGRPFTVVSGSVVGWVDTHPACIAAAHIAQLAEETEASKEERE